MDQRDNSSFLYSTTMDWLEESMKVHTSLFWLSSNVIRKITNSKKKSIYYDVACSPEKHFGAFVQLNKLAKSLNIPDISPFPIRKSWIPAYTLIDTKILIQHVLKIPMQTFPTVDKKQQIWAKVCNIKSKIFKDQGGLLFSGMIATDGIGVSVMKQKPSIKYGTRRKAADDRDEVYISSLSPEQHQELLGKCVLVDPNRRDLLFCLHENSTSSWPATYRYTQMQRRKETRSHHYRNIENRVKPLDVQRAENSLTGLEDFNGYLEKRALVRAKLENFYTRTVTRAGHPLHRKLRLGTKICAVKADQRLVKNLKKSLEVILFWCGDPGARHTLNFIYPSVDEDSETHFENLD